MSPYGSYGGGFNPYRPYGGGMGATGRHGLRRRIQPLRNLWRFGAYPGMGGLAAILGASTGMGGVSARFLTWAASGGGMGGGLGQAWAAVWEEAWAPAASFPDGWPPSRLSRLTSG